MKWLKRITIILAVLAVLDLVALYIIAFRTTQLEGKYIEIVEQMKQDHESGETFFYLSFGGDLVKYGYCNYAELLYDDFTKEDIEATFFNGHVAVGYRYKPDKAAIYSMLMKLYQEPVDATIEFHNGVYELVNEVNTYNFDVDRAFESVCDQISTKAWIIDMDAFMLRPKVTVDDLYEQYKRVRWLNDFRVTFKGGVVVDANYLYPYVNEDYFLELGSIDFTRILDRLDELYTTNKTTREFVSSNNELVDVKLVTYGKILDREATQDIIVQCLRTHESLPDAEPVLTGYDSDMSTYVEVSIENQHVWHYVDNKLCCETDCVTGLKGVHDTPKGLYYITERIPGKYLVGDDYKTWVNQWMRLTNSGIGLHDAYWKSQFGGTQYVYAGSHGCINLPPTYAESLFDEVRVGIPVIVY